jgi:hypothetical protein
MSDWSRGFDKGLGGGPPPTGEVEHAGWAAAQEQRRQAEERLRSGSGSGNSPGDVDWSTPTPLAETPRPGPASPVDAASAMAGVKGLLILAALLFFSPVTIPAGAAAVVGTPLLMALMGAPRPDAGRAFVATFAGFIVYMASVGIVVGMSMALTGALSPDRLTRETLTAMAIGQALPLAGFALVSSWWVRRRVPKLGEIARAFVAGAIAVIIVAGITLGLAWKLGLA